MWLLRVGVHLARFRLMSDVDACVIVMCFPGICVPSNIIISLVIYVSLKVMCSLEGIFSGKMFCEP